MNYSRHLCSDRSIRIENRRRGGLRIGGKKKRSVLSCAHCMAKMYIYVHLNREYGLRSACYHHTSRLIALTGTKGTIRMTPIYWTSMVIESRGFSETRALNRSRYECPVTLSLSRLTDRVNNWKLQSIILLQPDNIITSIQMLFPFRHQRCENKVETESVLVDPHLQKQ